MILSWKNANAAEIHFICISTLYLYAQSHLPHMTRTSVVDYTDHLHFRKNGTTEDVAGRWQACVGTWTRLGLGMSGSSIINVLMLKS